MYTEPDFLSHVLFCTVQKVYVPPKELESVLDPTYWEHVMEHSLPLLCGTLGEVRAGVEGL